MRSILQRIVRPAGPRLRPWIGLGVAALASPALASPPARADLAEMLDGKLPQVLFDVGFMGVELWQWTGLAVLVALAWIGAWLMGAVVRRLLQPLVRNTETLLDDTIVEALHLPVRALLTVALFATGNPALGLPDAAYPVLASIEITLVVIGATWILVRLVDILAEFAKNKLEASDRRAAIAVVPLGARTLKAFFLVVAGLALLQNLGFDVTGLIAGLGVGGLAVALAAQKTIANLFGGVSIIADQPVRVGDFCRYGDGQVGTVEEIGIRSTRVRSLDRTLVTVPNSDFSELRLENFAKRDRVRLQTTIGLRYETSPDQLRHVLTGLRKMLIAHPRVFEELRRVRFVGFGSSSLDIEIFTYITTEDWSEFLAIREDIFLRVMDIVAASGTGFAFPSQTLYLGRDSGLDADKTGHAEDEVSVWRDAVTLPFPEFSPETTAGITPLDYPPRGSETRVTDPADG